MLKKQILDTEAICKVEFSLSETLQGETVYLVGDFNNWNETATPMQRNANGSFTIVLELATNRDYQFRYLINRTEWHNDWEADRYVPNAYGGDNSVVSTRKSGDT